MSDGVRIGRKKTKPRSDQQAKLICSICMGWPALKKSRRGALLCDRCEKLEQGA